MEWNKRKEKVLYCSDVCSDAMLCCAMLILYSQKKKGGGGEPITKDKCTQDHRRDRIIRVLDRLPEPLSSVSFRSLRLSDHAFTALNPCLNIHPRSTEAMITHKKDDDKEGNSRKADTEPVSATVPENGIAAALIDVRLDRSRDTEADGDGILHHGRDERAGHALLLRQDRVGDEDAGRRE